MQFNLSLGLFSSFDIDSGTKLLLKTIAQQEFLKGSESVLDAGCGVGTIAISLKKRFPTLSVTASDRDALALKFTQDNIKLNGFNSEDIKTASGLLPGSLQMPIEGLPARYDSIISNIPAKAGNPVIEDFIKNCGLHLNEEGKAAIVIVEPLADFAKECLNESGAQIIYTEADKNYSVFHFIPEKQTETKSFSEVYERTNDMVSGFYGLPEFDSISYATKITLEMISKFQNGRKTIIWNPGIGHIPLKCSNKKNLVLASSDLLQLKATNYNVGLENRSLHLSKFTELEKNELSEIDYIIASPDFITGAEVEKDIIETSKKLLRTGGKLIVTGKSSDISRVEKRKDNFIIKQSIKFRGFRSLFLEKQ
ncbi:MAG: methyltransferase [Spirochaetales bacterium]|nr:methyltransferase [Spirochaetales bacterium]